MNTAPFRDLCNIPDSGNDKSGIIMSRWQSIRWMIQKSAKKGNDKTADECDR